MVGGSESPCTVARSMQGGLIYAPGAAPGHDWGAAVPAWLT